MILEHLGDVYLKLGNKDAAREAWKKSLESDEQEEGFKERIEKKLQELK